MPGKRKRSGGPPPPVQSVSCVEFIDDATPKLATAGATDGAIKIWDLRMLATSSGSTLRRAASTKAKPLAPTPIQVLHPPVEDGMRTRGITSLTVDPTGSRLLATTVNSVIYLYDTRWCASSSSKRLSTSGGSRSSNAAAAGSSSASSSSAGAGGVPHGDEAGDASVAQFRGHRVDSFYVKSTFSPDGKHIRSAPSDMARATREADRPSAPPIVLVGAYVGEYGRRSWCAAEVGIRSLRVGRHHSARLASSGVRAAKRHGTRGGAPQSKRAPMKRRMTTTVVEETSPPSNLQASAPSKRRTPPQPSRAAAGACRSSWHTPSLHEQPGRRRRRADEHDAAASSPESRRRRRPRTSPVASASSAGRGGRICAVGSSRVIMSMIASVILVLT